jgi:hypothetical protein
VGPYVTLSILSKTILSLFQNIPLGFVNFRFNFYIKIKIVKNIKQVDLSSKGNFKNTYLSDKFSVSKESDSIYRYLFCLGVGIVYYTISDESA